MLAGSAVALAALLAYAPVLTNAFVNRDDLTMFGDGPIRRADLAAMLVPRRDFAGYMPAGYLLLAGVFHAGGARLAPFHLAALLLHAANAVLLFLLILLLLRRAGGGGEPLEPARRACAALAAVFFAVHPIHAEGIAVASSLGDLSASLFVLASALCYVRAKSGAAAGGRLMGASLAFAALAGLSRWTGAAVPAFLLILDAYPLKRLGRKALVEKLPYVLIGVLVVAANVYAKMGPAGAGEVQRADLHPGAIAAGLVFYVWKWLVPGEYALYYVLDRPAELMGLPAWACAALLAAAVAALVAARRRAPAALAAFAAHAVSVAPVLLTTTNTFVQGHNRYAYLTGMALAAASAGGLLAAWRGRRKALALALSAAVAAACLGFGAQARGLAAEWHDNARLWSATLSGAPEEFFAFHAVGEAMLRRGEHEAALRQFRDRLNDHPGDERARRKVQELEARLFAAELHARGTALAAAGDLDAAVKNLEWALFLRPDLAGTREALAEVRARKAARAK